MIFKKLFTRKPKYKFHPILINIHLFEQAMNFARKQCKGYTGYIEPLHFGYYWGWADCEAKYSRSLEASLKVKFGNDEEVSQFMKNLRSEIDLLLRVGNEQTKENKI